MSPNQQEDDRTPTPDNQGVEKWDGRGPSPPAAPAPRTINEWRGKLAPPTSPVSACSSEDITENDTCNTSQNAHNPGISRSAETVPRQSEGQRPERARRHDVATRYAQKKAGPSGQSSHTRPRENAPRPTSGAARHKTGLKVSKSCTKECEVIRENYYKPQVNFDHVYPALDSFSVQITTSQLSNYSTTPPSTIADDAEIYEIDDNIDYDEDEDVSGSGIAQAAHERSGAGAHHENLVVREKVAEEVESDTALSTKSGDSGNSFKSVDSRDSVQSKDSKKKKRVGVSASVDDVGLIRESMQRHLASLDTTWIQSQSPGSVTSSEHSNTSLATKQQLQYLEDEYINDDQSEGARSNDDLNIDLSHLEIQNSGEGGFLEQLAGSRSTSNCSVQSGSYNKSNASPAKSPICKGDNIAFEDESSAVAGSSNSVGSSQTSLTLVQNSACDQDPLESPSERRGDIFESEKRAIPPGEDKLLSEENIIRESELAIQSMSYFERMAQRSKKSEQKNDSRASSYDANMTIGSSATSFVIEKPPKLRNELRVNVSEPESDMNKQATMSDMGDGIASKEIDVKGLNKVLSPESHVALNINGSGMGESEGSAVDDCYIMNSSSPQNQTSTVIHEAETSPTNKPSVLPNKVCDESFVIEVCNDTFDTSPLSPIRVLSPSMLMGSGIPDKTVAEEQATITSVDEVAKEAGHILIDTAIPDELDENEDDKEKNRECPDNWSSRLYGRVGYAEFYETLKKRSNRRKRTNRAKRRQSFPRPKHLFVVPGDESEEDEEEPLPEEGSKSPGFRECPVGKEVPPGWKPGEHGSHPITQMSVRYAIPSVKRKTRKALPRRRGRRSRMSSLSEKRGFTFGTDSISPIGTIRKSPTVGQYMRRYNIRYSDGSESEDSHASPDEFEYKRRYFEDLKKMRDYNSPKDLQVVQPREKSLTSQVNLLKAIDTFCSKDERYDEMESSESGSETDSNSSLSSSYDSEFGPKESLAAHQVAKPRLPSPVILPPLSIPKISAERVRIRKNAHIAPSIMSRERAESLSTWKPYSGDREPSFNSTTIYDYGRALQAQDYVSPIPSPKPARIHKKRNKRKRSANAYERNTEQNKESSSKASPHGCPSESSQEAEIKRQSSLKPEIMSPPRQNPYLSPLQKGALAFREAEAENTPGHVKPRRCVRFADQTQGPNSQQPDVQDNQWLYTVNAMLLKANKADEEKVGTMPQDNRFPRSNSARVVTPITHRQPRSQSFLGELLKQDQIERRQAKIQADLEKRLDDNNSKVNEASRNASKKDKPTTSKDDLFSSMPDELELGSFPYISDNRELITNRPRPDRSSGVLKIRTKMSQAARQRALEFKATGGIRRPVSPMQYTPPAKTPQAPTQNPAIPFRIGKPLDLANPNPRTYERKPLRSLRNGQTGQIDRNAQNIFKVRESGATLVSNPSSARDTQHARSRSGNYLLDQYSDTFKYYNTRHLRGPKSCVTEMFPRTYSGSRLRAGRDANANNSAGGRDNNNNSRCNNNNNNNNNNNQYNHDNSNNRNNNNNNNNNDSNNNSNNNNNNNNNNDNNNNSNNNNNNNNNSSSSSSNNDVNKEENAKNNDNDEDDDHENVRVESETVDSVNSGAIAQGTPRQPHTSPCSCIAQGTPRQPQTSPCSWTMSSSRSTNELWRSKSSYPRSAHHQRNQSRESLCSGSTGNVLSTSPLEDYSELTSNFSISIDVSKATQSSIRLSSQPRGNEKHGRTQNEVTKLIQITESQLEALQKGHELESRSHSQTQNLSEHCKQQTNFLREIAPKESCSSNSSYQLDRFSNDMADMSMYDLYGQPGGYYCDLVEDVREHNDTNYDYCETPADQDRMHFENGGEQTGYHNPDIYVEKRQEYYGLPQKEIDLFIDMTNAATPQAGNPNKFRYTRAEMIKTHLMSQRKPLPKPPPPNTTKFFTLVGQQMGLNDKPDTSDENLARAQHYGRVSKIYDRQGNYRYEQTAVEECGSGDNSDISKSQPEPSDFLNSFDNFKTEFWTQSLGENDNKSVWKKEDSAEGNQSHRGSLQSDRPLDNSWSQILYQASQNPYSPTGSIPAKHLKSTYSSTSANTLTASCSSSAPNTTRIKSRSKFVKSKPLQQKQKDLRSPDWVPNISLSFPINYHIDQEYFNKRNLEGNDSFKLSSSVQENTDFLRSMRKVDLMKRIAVDTHKLLNILQTVVRETWYLPVVIIKSIEPFDAKPFIIREEICSTYSSRPSDPSPFADVIRTEPVFYMADGTDFPERMFTIEATDPGIYSLETSESKVPSDVTNGINVARMVKYPLNRLNVALSASKRLIVGLASQHRDDALQSVIKVMDGARGQQVDYFLQRMLNLDDVMTESIRSTDKSMSEMLSYLNSSSDDASTISESDHRQSETEEIIVLGNHKEDMELERVATDEIAKYLVDIPVEPLDSKTISDEFDKLAQQVKELSSRAGSQETPEHLNLVETMSNILLDDSFDPETAPKETNEHFWYNTPRQKAYEHDTIGDNVDYLNGKPEDNTMKKVRFCDENGQMVITPRQPNASPGVLGILKQSSQLLERCIHHDDSTRCQRCGISISGPYEGEKTFTKDEFSMDVEGNAIYNQEIYQTSHPQFWNASGPYEGEKTFTKDEFSMDVEGNTIYNQEIYQTSHPQFWNAKPQTTRPLNPRKSGAGPRERQASQQIVDDYIQRNSQEDSDWCVTGEGVARRKTPLDRPPVVIKRSQSSLAMPKLRLPPINKPVISVIPRRSKSQPNPELLSPWDANSEASRSEQDMCCSTSLLGMNKTGSKDGLAGSESKIARAVVPPPFPKKLKSKKVLKLRLSEAQLGMKRFTTRRRPKRKQSSSSESESSSSDNSSDSDSDAKESRRMKVNFLPRKGSAPRSISDIVNRTLPLNYVSLRDKLFGPPPAAPTPRDKVANLPLDYDALEDEGEARTMWRLAFPRKVDLDDKNQRRFDKLVARPRKRVQMRARHRETFSFRRDKEGH